MTRGTWSITSLYEQTSYVRIGDDWKAGFCHPVQPDRTHMKIQIQQRSCEQYTRGVGSEWNEIPARRDFDFPFLSSTTLYFSFTTFIGKDAKTGQRVTATRKHAKMSQSPLARSTRKSLPAFAHPPSRLSKSTSIHNFHDSPSPSPSPPVPVSTPTSTPTPTAKTSYKNASTTPSTPKILYSPYATSSPHAGPSRSASIPFDMAASARDARRKSIGPQPGREISPDNEGDNEVISIPAMKKRKGIMRKKHLFTR